MKSYSFKLYEHDHFYKTYEDVKNNLYILELTDSMANWIDENIEGHFDINCDNYYSHNGGHIIIEFSDVTEAMAFKLYWSVENEKEY